MNTPGAFSLIPLSLLALFVAGCSTKSTSTPDAPSTNATYRLESADVEALNKVGCRQAQTSIRCEDPEQPSVNDDKLAKLRQSRAHVDQQIEALRDVQRKIDARLKAGTIPANARVSANLLSANLISREAELLIKSVSKGGEITGEQLYQMVLGYQCVGSHRLNLAEMPISESILFANGSAFSKDFAFNAAGDLNLTLKMNDKKEIGFGGVDQLVKTEKKVGFYARSDSEFTARAFTESKLVLGCSKIRGSQNTAGLTDQPAERRSLKCVSNSSVVDPASKAAAATTGYAVTFGVGASDQMKVLQLARPDSDQKELLKEELKGSVYETLVFEAQVTSHQGTLTFAITERATGKLLYEVKTSNSNPGITVGFSDKAGNEIRLACGNKVP